jgi:diguanylate cyclase (GGDEF)-like protein
MAAPRFRVRPAWAHAGLPITVTVLAGLYLTVPALQGVLYLAVSLLPIGAIWAGIRLNRVTDRRPWRIASAALALMATPNVAWVVEVDIRGGTAVASEFYAVAALGYVGIVVATGLIVLRHAPADPGGVLQAALTGLGLSGPVWEVVLRPVTRGAGFTADLDRIVVLVIVVALMCVTGSLLRLVSTTVRARASLVYLFLSVLFTIVAITAITASSGEGRTGITQAAETIAFVGYLSIGASALHPAVRYLGRPEGNHPDELSAGQLLRTGAVLLMVPLTAAATLVTGRGPDLGLLIVSSVISTPLVLIRFWHLGVQRLEAQRALAHQAAHDELTGLPNRRILRERVVGAVSLLREGALDSIAVLFCDLNDFKPINDRFGHKAGDHVLRVVAQRLRDCTRSTDVVGRFGGDEFLVVCTDVTRASVADIVKRIDRAFAQPVQIDAVPCTVGASIGVAVAEAGSGMSADELIAEADHRMYDLKRARAERGSLEPTA